MNKSLLSLLFLLIGISLGGGIVYWKLSSQPVMSGDMAMPAPIAETEKKPLFYRNPMNPEVTSPVPAQDYMGMDYIPVYADDDNAHDKVGTVKIDPVTEQNIGVRTAVAKLQTLSHPIRTVGKVTYDEERISRLHPKTEGWIEKLFVDKTGTQVKKNTMLLSIYSPQLVTSAQEYLLARKSAETLKDSPFDDIRNSAEQMVTSAHERLALLDVPEHQIKDMIKTGKIQKALHIHSPFDGTVINIGAREGQYVTPQTELYMLADLHKVWVIAQVYESDLPWVKENDPVEMQLTALPGQIFKGHLSYIYPYAEAKTRTIKVRLVFDNPDLLLKPEMFANVTIHGQQQQNAITVPSEAVIRSGAEEQVFVVRAAGKYEPRTVQTGVSADGMTQIISGIKAGEEVVSSSQFLIDSESNLKAAAEKMRGLSESAEMTADMDMTEPTSTVTQDHSAMDHASHEMPVATESQPDEVHQGHDMSDNSMTEPDMQTMPSEHQEQHAHD